MKNHDSSKNNADRRPRSGGPQTPAGKQQSAANSRRHGILSENIVVLCTESEAQWEDLLNGYLEEFQPVGFLENRLVQQIAWAEWRQFRAIRVESATINRQIDLDGDRVKREYVRVDNDTRTCVSVQKLVDTSNDLQHLSRYETRFNRMYYRALNQLLAVQQKRRRDGQPTEPAPVESVESEAPQPEKSKLPNEQPVAASEPDSHEHPRNGDSETPPPLIPAAA
jgi:hypothetical protein